MPLTTSPIRWSMTAKACSTGRFGTRSSKRLLSRRISESVRSRSRWMPARAFTIRPRSARNGVVARLITTLPAPWASSATWGATPVPDRAALGGARANGVEERLVPGARRGREPHPCSPPGGPRVGPPCPRAGGVARPRHIDLSLGPFYGLVEPPPDILPDRIADRVLDGDGVARLHELLEVHDVPFRQFDHELADVVRRELHVDEPIDRRANRVGNRGEVAALDELMKRLDLVRGNSDRNPLGFRWHMDPSPRPTSRVILSDNRMATALYKRTVQTVLLQYLGHDGPHLNKRTRDGPRRTSDNKGGA